jgi:hypothetical protein
MNTQTEGKIGIKELFDPLRQWVNTDELSYDELKEFYFELQNVKEEFQNKLEFISQIKRVKNLEKLYSQIAGENESALIDRLTAKGHYYKKELGDAFENMGYRLLEQARAGKRDDVYYGILRIFVSYQKKFPNDLIEAFKPIYSKEMFKVFIFSFLSGIIGKDQQNKN